VARKFGVQEVERSIDDHNHHMRDLLQKSIAKNEDHGARIHTKERTPPITTRDNTNLSRGKALNVSEDVRSEAQLAGAGQILTSPDQARL